MYYDYCICMWVKVLRKREKCIFTQKNKSTCMNIHNNNRRLIWRWDGGGSGQVYTHCSTFAVMISLWVKWNVCVILIHQSNNNIHCQNWIFQEIYCFCLALDDMMIIITIVVRGVSFYFYSWLWSHFTYLYRVIFLCVPTLVVYYIIITLIYITLSLSPSLPHIRMQLYAHIFIYSFIELFFSWGFPTKI